MIMVLLFYSETVDDAFQTPLISHSLYFTLHRQRQTGTPTGWLQGLALKVMRNGVSPLVLVLSTLFHSTEVDFG